MPDASNDFFTLRLFYLAIPPAIIRKFGNSYPNQHIDLFPCKHASFRVLLHSQDAGARCLRRSRTVPQWHASRISHAYVFPGLIAAWGFQIDLHFRAFDGCQRLPFILGSNLKAIPFPVIPPSASVFFVVSPKFGELSAWIFLDDGKV